jgi:multiple sugar transport system substrate-binding protein
LCFNKKAFDEVGLAYPTNNWTPNDYRAAAQKLVKRDASGKVTRWGALPGADFFYISVPLIMQSHDGAAFSSDGKKWVAGLDPFLKKNVEALEPYVAMGGVDKSAPTPAQTRELGFGEGMFERAEVAMRHCGFFLFPSFNKITAFDWGAVVNERWQEHPYIGITPLAFGMSDASKNKDAAWAFIKYAMSPDAQTLQFKLTAQLPSNVQVLNSDTLTQDAMFKHIDMKAWIKEAMANGHAIPGPADTPVAPFSIQGVWEQSMDKAWKGEISVEQALKEMQPNMEKLFAKEAP